MTDYKHIELGTHKKRRKLEETKQDLFYYFLGLVIACGIGFVLRILL